jgi:membrane-anchored protein YejM (alkaline phosphatase superfamily)
MILHIGEDWSLKLNMQNRNYITHELQYPEIPLQASVCSLRGRIVLLTVTALAVLKMQRHKINNLWEQMMKGVTKFRTYFMV